MTSAERPVTETEGKLLGYIKEWGKKVVMVLNKVCKRDLLISKRDLRMGYIKEWGKKGVMVLNKVCMCLCVSVCVCVCMYIHVCPLLCICICTQVDLFEDLLISNVHKQKRPTNMYTRGSLRRPTNK